jgi:hypothetical protein
MGSKNIGKSASIYQDWSSGNDKRGPWKIKGGANILPMFASRPM